MGLLSDADADHDLPGLVRYIDDAVVELLDAAGISRQSPPEPPGAARSQRSTPARKASPRKTSPRKAGGRAGRRP
jgi:hypothetical protein